MARKYVLKRRAERQEETRQRIVEAVVALHEEVGPAQTTISAIAERAGVERLTVYRHFPDERSLFEACSARFDELHPRPDPRPWTEIADPIERLRVALTQIYASFRESEQMLANVYRDAPRVAAIQSVLATYAPYWTRVSTILLDGWQPAADQQPLLAAAVGHALEFQTWRTLVRQHGLTDMEVVELMVCLVFCAAGGHCQ
jgi:AcrR family transcriptional regulator